MGVISWQLCEQRWGNLEVVSWMTVCCKRRSTYVSGQMREGNGDGNQEGGHCKPQRGATVKGEREGKIVQMRKL